DEIGAHDIPQIVVYNKVDALEPERRPRQPVDWIERPGGVRVPRVFVSALDGTGLDRLRELIAESAAAALPAEQEKPADARGLNA
ncbi:MAG TPA: GTPase HflX, partial [Burkholderiaceae bacterium]